MYGRVMVRGSSKCFNGGYMVMYGLGHGTQVLIPFYPNVKDILIESLFPKIQEDIQLGHLTVLA